MFSLEIDEIGSHTKIKLLDTRTGSHLAIVPSFGANVLSLELHHQNRTSFAVIDGYEEESTLVQHSGYKSSKLMPFPNRINSGQYTWNNKAYQLPINKLDHQHAMHGLVYKAPFELIEVIEEERQIVAIFAYHFLGNVEGYPFPFYATLAYAFSGNEMVCTTTVENIGKSAIPFGDGWHPYLTLGMAIDNCELMLPSVVQLAVNERMIPTGEEQPFSDFEQWQIIGNRHFDLGLRCLQKGTNVVSLRRPNDSAMLQLWQNEAYPYLQVYTPPHRKSIAIEPMSCSADAFNNGNGLKVLAPKAIFKGQYGVKII